MTVKTVESFVEEFTGAPLELHEFAEAASKVEDDWRLALLATRYLNSQDEFISYMHSIGVEIG